MEMICGRSQVPSVFSAVCKRSCNADRADRIQSVRILYDLSFKRCGLLSPVFAE